jgi:hypothetical protein
MNIFKKQMTSFEITTLVIFVIYLILPMKTPSMVSQWLNKPVGILAIFVITIYLFMYAHPALGVLYLFVAYELLRRSGSVFVPEYKPMGTSYTKMPIHPYSDNVVTQHRDNELTQNEADDLYYANKVADMNALDSSYGPIGVNSKNNYPTEEHVNENNVKHMDVHYENLEEEIVSKKDPNAILGEMSNPFPQNRQYVATYDISSLSASGV